MRKNIIILSLLLCAIVCAYVISDEIIYVITNPLLTRNELINHALKDIWIIPYAIIENIFVIMELKDVDDDE